MNTLWKLATLAIACGVTAAVSPASAQTGDATASPSGANGQAMPGDAPAMRQMMRQMMEDMMSREQRGGGDRGPHWNRDRYGDRMARHGRRDGWRDRRGGMHGPAMKILFAVADADGDGALSLQEIQDFHARIFKGVDGNADGRVDMEEIQIFFHGRADDRMDGDLGDEDQN
ncbi:EF-hand domain-containing protein [Arvimicrobium flavum]|uniref:EF-hand domain-containing protein n=1 Tax=Arvimicrobium flavum TaxID=3393320 RepID=UPI00237B140A|nr:EF-hand domain-containing protein [Mesorhizobium shangrilense]